MTVTPAQVAQIRARAAELLRDPDRVVRNRFAMFEDEDGTRLSTQIPKPESNCRVCGLGAVRLAVVEILGLTNAYDAMKATIVADPKNVAIGTFMTRTRLHMINGALRHALSTIDAARETADELEKEYA